MHRNCSTCRNNDDKHQVLCAECIRVGGASGLPHYEEGTPEEIARNAERVALVWAMREGERLMRGNAITDGPLHPVEAVLHHAPASEDMVNLPKHYARFKIEPIRFVVENLGPAFLQGNIIKYVLRFDAKNGIEDLRKARRYLDMLIAFLEGDRDWWKVKP